jgi:hypothetical protein
MDEEVKRVGRELVSLGAELSGVFVPSARCRAEPDPQPDGERSARPAV